MIKKQYINLLFLGLLIPIISFAQEFTIKQTPEQIQRKQELKLEKKYLDFQTHFFEAIHQKAGEDYNKAIEALENCKIIYPNDAGMNFEFAKNYLLLKDYENAIYFDEAALKAKSENIYVLEHLKKTYKAQHDMESAIAIQKRIVAVKPSQKQDLIMLYIGNRQRDKAKAVYLELKESKQIITNTDYFERVLLPKKRYKENRKNSTEITKNKYNKKTKKTIVKRAKTDQIELEKNKELKEIIRLKTKSKITKSKIKRDYNSSDGLKEQFKGSKNYHTLKKLIAKADKKKNYTEIAEDCKMGLLYYPAQNYLYYMQGKAQNKLGDHQEALEVLKAGLDFVIDDKATEIKFYEQIIKAYKDLGNKKESLQFSEKLRLLKA